MMYTRVNSKKSKKLHSQLQSANKSLQSRMVYQQSLSAATLNVISAILNLSESVNLEI